MSGLPWVKFYWSAWSSDPALKLCSMAAQGFWMRMLCIAAEAEQVGYVMINGRPLDLEDMAAAVERPKDEIAQHCGELLHWGVMRMDKVGRAYCPWMVADAVRASLRLRPGKIDAREAVAIGASWSRTRAAVLRRDGRRCRYCGSTDGPFHIDHIKPRSRGGSNSPRNLTVACRTCNTSKGAKSLKDWLK